MGLTRTKGKTRLWAAVGVVVATAATTVPSVGAAPVRPMASPYGTSVVVDGRGNGHGIGLSQYGALGYAIDDGWTSAQILDHYYGGTTAGTIANDALRVRLTALDDQQTAVVGNLIATNIDARQWKSIVVRPDATLGPRGSKVWARADAMVCPSSTDDLSLDPAWTALPDQGDTRLAPVDILVPSETPSTDAAELGALCVPGGTVRSYRGIIRAVAGTTDERRTVNVVPIESYLRGVVPSEMPAGWAGLGGGRGLEALKAQVVAARSYAKVQTRYSYADTCDTQACQVYGGAARRTGVSTIGLTLVEQPNTDTAIVATAGSVRLTAGGQVANTMFSSSSGGYTTPSTSPGFPPVPDDGDDVSINPYTKWQTSIPVTAVEAKWPQIGTLTQITVTKRNGYGADGGRVLEMVIVGTAGRVTRTGDEFRLAFDLRSNWFSVRGDVCSGRIEPDVTGFAIPTTAVGMTPVTPTRVIDTRNGIGTAALPLGAGCTLAFAPANRPTGAVAAAIVLTTTQADAGGYTTAYPCGTGRPEVSAVQILAGLDIPGTTVVPLGVSGQICVYSSVTTEVLVDVMGWLAPGGDVYVGSSPQRLLDSRQGGAARLAPGSVTPVQVPSVGGVIPTSASVNITATGAAGNGYVTAYPCDQASGETSVANFRPSVDIANHVFVDLDAQGRFCLVNSAPVHLIADLDGSFGASAGARTVRVQAPVRVIDSRASIGTTGVLVANGPGRPLDLGDASGGILAELTIVDPGSAGYVTVYPCDDATLGGGTSVINTPKSTNVANLILMRTDAAGQICIRTTMNAHVLVDVIGRV